MEHIATAGVHDPDADVRCRQACGAECTLQYLLRMLSRQEWHRTCQHVAQHSLASLKLQGVALKRIGQRREALPFERTMPEIG